MNASSPPPREAPASKGRYSGKTWFRRHPFFIAFMGLSLVGMFLSAVVQWMVLGYVFNAPSVPTEVDSLVAVDALFGFAMDPVAVSPKRADIGVPPEPPADELAANPAQKEPTSRLLEALYRRGRLPAKWASASGVSPEDLADMIVRGEGSYGRSPSDVRRAAGVMVQGRDQSGRELIIMTSVDRTEFPVLTPCFEFVFARSANNSNWVMVSRQRFKIDAGHLMPWLNMWGLIGASEVLIALLVVSVWGLDKRSKGALKNNLVSSICVAIACSSNLHETDGVSSEGGPVVRREP